MRRIALAICLFFALALPAAANRSSVAIVKAAYNKELKATILVDGAGRTLYLFTSDLPNESTCTDPQCQKIWLAYTGTPKAGPGVKASSRHHLGT